MKTVYKRLFSHAWLPVLWLMGLALPLSAQLSVPPVIKWQSVIEGGINDQSQVRLAKTSAGEFGVLNGTGLSYLTALGVLKSVAAVEGSVQTSSSPTVYTKVLTTAGLAPTEDGGFIVLANDAANLYIIKKDAANNRVWSTVITASVFQSNVEEYIGLDILPTAGGYLVFAGHRLANFLSNVTVTKVNGSGTILWSKDVFDKQAASSLGVTSRSFTKVVASPDGTYLLVGKQTSFAARPQPNAALAAKIDGQATLISSKTYSEAVAFSDAVINPYEAGTYFVLGITDPAFSGIFTGPTFPYKIKTDGTLVRLGRFTLNSVSKIASDGSAQPYYVILEGIDQNGGDFILSGFDAQDQSVWSKVLGGSSADSPQAILPTGDGYLLGGTTTSTNGDIRGKQGNALATWVVKLNKTDSPPTAGPLAVNVQTYDCNTGLLTLTTTGGNGAGIEYRILGNRDWSASNVFTLPSYQRQGTTFTLEARQTGQQANLAFTASCGPDTNPQPPTPPTPPTDPTGFYLRAPDFNCTTGKLTALYSNGTGGTVEYRIIGLRDWGTSPDFTVPAWQLVGTTFTIEGRLSNGTQSAIKFTTACGTTTPPPPSSGNALVFKPIILICGGGQKSTQIAVEIVGYPAWTSGIIGALEYKIPGLGDWQLMPGFSVPSYQSNGTTFTIYVRRVGETQEFTTTYTTSCSVSSRIGSPEPGMLLEAVLYPNPVGEQFQVEVRGVARQAVNFTLMNVRGEVVHTRQTMVETDLHQETFSLPRSASGLYLLRVETDDQRKTLKVMKP